MLSVLLIAGFRPIGTSQSCDAAANSAMRDAKVAIYGQITDPTGAPIPRAQVVLKSGAGNRIYNKADDHGCYQFSVLPGNYILGAKSQGFRTGSITAHAESGTQKIEIIELQIGGCTECVDVQGMPQFAPCIEDSMGTPVANANVKLRGLGRVHSQQYQITKLDDWGCGWIQVAPGKYKISATAPGFRSWRRTFDLEGGQAAYAPLTLHLVHKVVRPPVGAAPVEPSP